MASLIESSLFLLGKNVLKFDLVVWTTGEANRTHLKAGID